jgi:NAD(P)-dependent dehydrogenase (short-subunit alcohol dehydrogenase family)
MAQERVAVVTGANKGIGYSIVKELSKKFDGLIYLTGIRIDFFCFFKHKNSLRILFHK